MPYCPNCGGEVTEDDRFCPSCGQELRISAVQEPAAEDRRVSEQFRQRPTGVTVLAVLEILGGLLFFGLGATLLVVAGFIGIAGLWPVRGMFPAFIGGLIASFVGGIMVIVGILNFVIAYGYLNGRGWAWTLGLVFAVLGIIIGLISLPGGVIRILLDGLILYYLTRPRVKRFFGKEPVPVTM